MKARASFVVIAAFIFTLTPVRAQTDAAKAKMAVMPPKTTVLQREKTGIAAPGKGGFDWMLVDDAADAEGSRLYAAQKGAEVLTVVDLKSRKLLAQVAVGTVQGIAIDTVGGKIYAGTADGANGQQIVVVDRKTFAILKRIKVEGPVDAMAFDPKRRRVYADEDDGTRVWVLDAKTDTRIGTVTIPGAPEYILYDAETDRLYQNIKKPESLTVVINPETMKTEGIWKTAPLTSAHGLALDAAHGQLMVAGAGMVVLLDRASGKILKTLEIMPGSVDQIAFDPNTRRLYCGCKGVLSVVKLGKVAGKAKFLGVIEQPAGAHTLAIEPNGTVWVSHAEGENGQLTPFSPAVK